MQKEEDLMGNDLKHYEAEIEAMNLILISIQMTYITLWMLYKTLLKEVLDRAITQRFSNLTNNHLRTSSNTRNQAIVQADRVHIQRRNSGNDGRYIRRSYVQEEVIEGTNVQNDAGN
ncbi:hypothetical protein Tco_0941362 [Tanacetum coccineum]|uniref:Uncharacterized protein n=1 Tax=Tanacetum coccineum TaxID=301880 RepID=A0ABQ5DRD3_9ASTR